MCIFNKLFFTENSHYNFQAKKLQKGELNKVFFIKTFACAKRRVQKHLAKWLAKPWKSIFNFRLKQHENILFKTCYSEHKNDVVAVMRTSSFGMFDSPKWFFYQIIHFLFF